MQRIVQIASRAMPNPRSESCIAFILTLVAVTAAFAADPPPGLARKVAEREALSAAERANYTYRQTVVIEEVDDRGGQTGSYREVREVIFSPEGERTERLSGRPSENLKRLKLTEEDFRDIRDIQPFLFTPDQVWAYETRFKGEENLDGVDCWLLQVRPRQILQGQRLFDGMFWVDKRDYSIVRSEGKAVPQIYSSKAERENLFPHFTTLRERVGDHWFPARTFADDTLPFRSGPIRIRLTVRYANYQRFSAESKITPVQE